MKLNSMAWIVMLASVAALPACGMKVGVDDATINAVECAFDKDCTSSNSGDSTAADDPTEETNPASVDDTSDDENLLNGIVWLDDSLKGENRFLMGTYAYHKYESWEPPVIMRAYSHMDGRIDFEDIDGHLLWIANTVDEKSFKYSTDIYVNSTAPLKSNCTCKQSWFGWSCDCGFTASAVKYTVDMYRMGLGEDAIYDDEDYAGITDQKDYSLYPYDISDGCNSHEYETPEDVTLQFRGRRIDFEDNTGDLLWSADLHEDETFDFTIGGYPDAFGTPTVDLTCGCQFTKWTGTDVRKGYDILHDDNNIRCYCESSEGVNFCKIDYGQN